MRSWSHFVAPEAGREGRIRPAGRGPMTMRGLSIVLTAGLVAFLGAWGPTAATQKKAGWKAAMPIEADGATRAFTASNIKGDEAIRFNDRASDAVLYDTKTGAMIGKLESINDERSRLVFNDKSPFHATFAITSKGRGL